MAKTSMVERNNKRRRLAKKFKVRRTRLKAIAAELKVRPDEALERVTALHQDTPPGRTANRGRDRQRRRQRERAGTRHDKQGNGIVDRTRRVDSHPDGEGDRSEQQHRRGKPSRELIGQQDHRQIGRASCRERV